MKRFDPTPAYPGRSNVVIYIDDQLKLSQARQNEEQLLGDFVMHLSFACGFWRAPSQCTDCNGVRQLL